MKSNPGTGASARKPARKPAPAKPAAKAAARSATKQPAATHAPARLTEADPTRRVAATKKQPPALAKAAMPSKRAAPAKSAPPSKKALPSQTAPAERPKKATAAAAPLAESPRKSSAAAELAPAPPAPAPAAAQAASPPPRSQPSAKAAPTPKPPVVPDLREAPTQPEGAESASKQAVPPASSGMPAQAAPGPVSPAAVTTAAPSPAVAAPPSPARPPGSLPPGLPPHLHRPPPRPLGPPETFAQGDHVVYPTHGVGKVERIAVEEIAGHKLELIHITFEENRMTLRVPVAKARTAGLRKLASRDLFDKAMDVLRGKARIKRTMWSRRAQEYEAKINSGDPLAIAEVVRDLHRNAGQPDQSFSERQIYESAMDRLAAELGALEKIDKTAAAQKLTDFLKTVV